MPIWDTYAVPGNRICWNVIQLDSDASEDEEFRNSHWHTTSSESVLSPVRDFKTPYGVLENLIKQTPKDVISMVFLEDIHYETWHHGRTVLIGDGQGAVNAMQDAVILASCLYDLEPLSFEGIKYAFKDYREQRFQHVKTQYESSQISAKIQYGLTILERMFRSTLLNFVPSWLLKKQYVKDSSYPPQATFLPLAPKRGIIAVLPQKLSRRYQGEQKMTSATAF
ncbi:hypothetical protein BGX28_001277 [Mortierella sp. GBA30]|nr:hypothetical protein BGX28_001277 [Mortierella sp. GBA30]